jgi:formate-dependent nitrite reductase membrane component NrfD
VSSGSRVHEIDDPRDVFSQITPSYDILKAATPQGVGEPGYYGLPILKRPFWKWEIALYFFFEGVSAGSYVLCTIASLRDRDRFSATIRTGRALSFFTMLTCPPLLIADLGRPERFHHMLRIFKRTSPMNHGAWALSGYGALASFLALLTLNASRLPLGGALLRLPQRWMPERLLAVLGMPFALTMISYPGVLLSTTANPVWAHTHFLGSLFACSSMSNGAAALSLCNYTAKNNSVHQALARFEDVSAVAEAGALGLYLGTTRKAARPLLRGKQSKLFLFGAIAIGLVAPALLRRSKSHVLRSGVAPLLTLAGGLALKWSITYAGQESAMDAELASQNAPTKSGDPFWGPKKSTAGNRGKRV